MAVRYAENLTLLRSTTGRDSGKGIKKKKEKKGGSEKTDTETRRMHRLLCCLLSVENRGR